MFRLQHQCAQALAHARLQFPDHATCVTPLHPSQVDAFASMGVKSAQRNPDDQLIVTFEGFIVMAVVPTLMKCVGDVVALPGCDHRGTRGWLVLGVSARAFHSRLDEVHDAIEEARIHHARATRLEAHFGGKLYMHNAVANAPWTLWSSFDDAATSGLCQWGIESFLRRFGLWHVSRALGLLPKAVLWWGGGYPRRVLAATLMRHERTLPAEEAALVSEPFHPR